MKKNTNKIPLLLAVFTAMIFAAPVYAQTASELQVQITSLLAQIQVLQSQLSSLSSPASSGSQFTAVFTRDLTIGSRGEDVRQLQIFLNAKGFLVASSGPGSPGFETGFFGPLTRNAVAAYQAANGITPATGFFGPKTRAFAAVISAPAVSSPTTPTVVIPTVPSVLSGVFPVIGVEGDITARLSPIPPNNVEVELGTTESVMAIEIRARNSDVDIKRIFLNFSNPGNIRPWQFLSSVSLYDGDILLKTVSASRANFEEVTFGSDYRLILDGFSFVVPSGATRTLTVKATALSAVDTFLAPLPQTLNITLKTNAIRGVDSAGLNQFAPSGDLTRAARILATATGRIEPSSPTVPRDAIAIGSDTGTTSDIPLLSFVLRAREVPINIRTITVNATTNAPFLTDVVNALKLVDGPTVIGSVTPAAASTFTDLNVFIPAGESRTLTVRGDLARVVVQGRWVQVSFTANAVNVVAEDANERTATVIAGSTTGSRHFIYSKASVIALNNASLVASTATGQQAQADGTITIAVTARGGDVFIRAGNGITAASNAQNTAVSVTSQNNLAVTASGNWKISSGSTEIFRVSVHLDNTGGIAGFKRAWLSSFVWNADDSVVYTTWTDQLGFGTALTVGDFKTGDVFLQN